MRWRADVFAALIGGVFAIPAAALDLSLPGDAVLTAEQDSAQDSYFLPTGPFANGILPTKELEGRVIRQAWRVEGGGHSTLKLLGAIRDQLRAGGYEILLDCAARECGGFDFRFGTEVLPGPAMFVDLFDYRFLSARNSAASGAEFVSVLVSRAGGSGYVQLVVTGQGDVGVSSSTPATLVSESGSTASVTPVPNPGTDQLAASLVQTGHAVLGDLEFATGSSTLSDGNYSSLKALADFLNANPDRRVALVGHTDNVGALQGNIDLSRKRAASVMKRLEDQHNVASAQMEADGTGYLAPIAPNTTPEGREANRRVEAVLLSAE